MHLFKEYAQEYIDKGISVIPDKFGGKNPLIKGWTEYNDRLPSKEEVNRF